MHKLLQINICYGYYSTGKIAENISEAVQSNGWKSYAAFRSDIRSRNTAILLPVGKKWGKYIHFVQSLLFDKHGQCSNSATANLIKNIERIKPDIVHIHNIHGYYLNIRLLLEYLGKKNIPVIVTTHDCWLFTGHCAHFTKISCDKWKTECYECALKDSYPRSLIDRSQRNYNMKKDLFSRMRNLHIVTVSQWLANIVGESFLKNNEIRVIHNGIDIDRFRIIDKVSAKILKLFDGKIAMAVSSAWYEDKGLSDYIRLSELLPPDIKLCLVGLTKQMIRKLPSNIIGITKTSSVDELVELYNRADVILSLSKSETFGLTIVEGYACGTPAVVYNNTALPELITSETGLVVENGNVEAACNAIITITSKGKRYFSEACRRLAVEKYNKGECVNEYVKLYNDILCHK